MTTKHISFTENKGMVYTYPYRKDMPYPVWPNILHLRLTKEQALYVASRLLEHSQALPDYSDELVDIVLHGELENTGGE